jgi:hypothetical protein
MRLFGARALSGRAPLAAESSYDLMYPIYDPAVELVEPIERPAELRAMEWDFRREDGKCWIKGENASTWADYPASVGEFHLIGERTFLIRPDWEWPREERYRGLLDNALDTGVDRESLASRHELTYDTYLRGIGQAGNQLIVWNSEEQLVGPAFRWIALNSAFARSLDWVPSPNEPFGWVDASGALMVKSVFWRDGWIGLEPPRFESLGEGWLVLATARGVERIRQKRPNATYHLWVERHSHGSKPYTGSWHLTSPVSTKHSAR